MIRTAITRPRNRNRGRPAEKHAPGFKQFIRGRDCLVGEKCDGKIEPAHVDYAGGKGMGTKVADSFTVPLCSRHHREQHQEGWSTFERHYFGKEGYALKASEELWRAWPSRGRWEAKNG